MTDDRDTLDQLVDTDQAAAMLGYAPGYVRRLFAEGKLPGRKFGKGWATTREHVEDYKQQREESKMDTDLFGAISIEDGRYRIEIYSESEGPLFADGWLEHADTLGEAIEIAEAMIMDYCDPDVNDGQQLQHRGVKVYDGQRNQWVAPEDYQHDA